LGGGAGSSIILHVWIFASRTHQRPGAGRAIALMVVCLLVALPVSAKKRDKGEEDTPVRPKVRLSVSTHHGFAPLDIVLTGQLEGVDLTDQQYCHVGVEWEISSPLGTVSTSKQDPRCLHPPEQTQVQFVFSKVTTLSRPGDYTYRLILHRRDGEPLMSNTQAVKVLFPN